MGKEKSCVVNGNGEGSLLSAKNHRTPAESTERRSKGTKKKRKVVGFCRDQMQLGGSSKAAWEREDEKGEKKGKPTTHRKHLVKAMHDMIKKNLA